jgi:SAM-dependent methyltransferase
MQARIGLKGRPPSVAVTQPASEPENPERKKYQELWANHEDYRNFAPGEHLAAKFLEVAKPEKDSEIIDFGCGTGRGSVLLAILGRLKVTMVDFAPNCIDDEMQDAINAQKRLNFVEADLTKPLPEDLKAEYGYCTDVLEHIPEEDVPATIGNVLGAAKKVFFQISTEPDVFGQRIGEKLHMTVQPAEWWVERFQEHNCMVWWVERQPNCLLCYVTGNATLEDLNEFSSVNTEQELIIENARINCAKGYRTIEPHAVNNQEVMILAGGPSLVDYTDEIIEKRKAGMPMITVNGTYLWALKNHLKPSGQVMVDAREFNKRFVPYSVENCWYFYNAQVHPACFENLPDEQVLLWASKGSEGVKDIMDEHYDMWWSVDGGCTVALRAIILLRMLGWKYQHIYGLDSCLRGDEHHAYAQPENDDEDLTIVKTNGKEFRCAKWMALQARDFRGIVDFYGSELQLAVYGDGLIANLLEDASDMEET